MEINKTHTGDVFIIPNALEIFRGELNEYDLNWRENIHADLDPDMPREEAYLQVWCTTPGNNQSNWGCHPSLEGEQRHFPSHLPISLFKGKKEGDVITFESPTWGHIELRLNCLSYRYRSYGRFEEVLAKLLERAGL